jgi:hypothetical protein
MIKVLFLLAIFAAGIGHGGAAGATETHCYSIRDNDEKNYCLAMAKRQDSYCYSIRESDAKNICLAQAKGQKSYCYSVRNSDNKNKCLALVR